MKVKKCPHWSKNQRSSFLVIIHHFLLIVLVLGEICSVVNEEEKIDYVGNNYGEVIPKENIQEGAKFESSEGIKITIDNQDVLTTDEIADANIFNDVSIITISMENDSEETVSYNTLGFTYVTQDDIQLDNAWERVFLMETLFYLNGEFRTVK